MNQFPIIFRYEYKGIVKSKVFIGITIFIAVAIAIVFSLPTIIGWFSGSGESDTGIGGTLDSYNETITNEGTIAIVDKSGVYADISDFTKFAPQYTYVLSNESDDEIRENLKNEKYKAAVVIDAPLSATYMVQSAGMYDYMSSTVGEILKYSYLKNTMIGMGAAAEDAETASLVYPSVSVVETGKSFMSSYIYAYAMIMLLYMCILLYGQLVATSVVTEKSSRAMELLITTTNPTSLIFGKVVGVGLAGLTQIAVFILTGAVFFKLNAGAISAIPMLADLSISPMMIVTTFLFFILGFFMYAFLFGALGSTITRMEEMNTSSMPIILLFVAAFMISIFGLTGDANSTFITVMSFIPFFSPMVMYVRICMTEVAIWQVCVSVVLMIATVCGTGYIAAKIYRIGVLMYGKPPKLNELVKALKEQ